MFWTKVAGEMNYTFYAQYTHSPSPMVFKINESMSFKHYSTLCTSVHFLTYYVACPQFPACTTGTQKLDVYNLNQ